MDIKQNKINPIPKSITKEKLKKILALIKKGAPKKHAAEATGVSERHLYYMLAQGINDLEHDVTDTIHAWLVQSLREIELSEILWCRSAIKENEKGHKGAEWTLEHAHWRQYCGDAKLMELAKELELIKGSKPNAVRD